MAEETGVIIFLNGTSSSGKTTIANTLTTKLPDFERMAIDDYWGQDHDLAHYIEEKDFQGTLKAAADAVYRFHRSIACRAIAGQNVIVDHVLENHDWAEHAAGCFLPPHRVLVVGVYCPLDVAIARENGRTDRISGTAQYQFPIIHTNKSYDLTVDTSVLSPEQCADQIAREVDKAQYINRNIREKFVLL